MREKTEKRLVGWNEYLRAASSRWLLNVTAIGLGCMGVACLRLTGVGMGRTLAYLLHPLTTPGGGLAISLTMIGSFCVLAVLTIWAASRLYSRAKAVPPVRLLTPENARHLPLEETLVRHSDLPSSHQKAELLRAARPGQETKPEELLRATATRGPEG